MPTPAHHDLTARMASVIELHVRCQCETIALWPWKREQKCGRCEILDEWAAYVAIVQLPAVPVEKKEK